MAITKEIRQIRKDMEKMLEMSFITREANRIRQEGSQKLAQELIAVRNKIFKLPKSDGKEMFLFIIGKSLEILKLSNEAMNITQGVVDDYESIIAKIILNTPINDKQNKVSEKI